MTGEVVTPPATIGMLGGGQLGRYAIVAARLAGYGTVVLDPDPSAPAGRVADRHLVAPYDDPAALDELAATCAVITTEFENPPAAALERLAADVAVAPPPAAVAVAQDRIAEKSFLADHGFAIAPWAPLVHADDRRAASGIGAPGIVKSARLGYDGKGQQSVDSTDALDRAWQALGGVPCVVERRVPLDVELSAIVARSATGATAVYPIAENEHRDGILDVTIVPARVTMQLASEASQLAVSVAAALDYVGVLAVEMFVSDGRLLVNELAPRPHNSGHWTLDGARTDQFAQQIRAITGSALGDPSLTAPAAAMVNLLGDLWFAAPGVPSVEPNQAVEPNRAVEPDWAVVLAEFSARLHLYGKRAARPGRKMGHLTVLGADATAAADLARSLRDQVRGD